MKQQLIEKIKKVSKHVEQTQDEDLEEQLESWGKQILQAEMLEDYRNLPMTQKIVEQLVKFVKNINRKLITQKDIDRSAYLADKDRCLWMIKILSHKYSRDLKIIEMAIDAELEDLEN